MKKPRLSLVLLALPAVFLGAAYAEAVILPGNFSAALSGYQEVPPVFSGASGNFSLSISSGGTSATYRLSYTGFTSPVLQAHIHFGPQPTNGGIIIFLCDNTGHAPAGTPLCPPSPGGTVTGTLTSAGVRSVTGQGIAAGNFAGLLGAIEHGDAYANVHSTAFPAGEIRGWLR